jgi:predicted enzyme related to lactoylglutathione lyase
MSRVVHFELPSTDIEASRKFYETVLGWKFEKYPGPMDYWLISTGDPSAPGIDGGIDGGLGGAANEIKGTVNTVGVGDIDEVLKQVLANGGQIIMPRGEIPGVGLLAYVREPGGAVFGVIQPFPDGMM